MKECPICFEKKNNIFSGYCDHEFCKDCILRWNKPTCPVCRQKLYAGPELPNVQLDFSTTITFLFLPYCHLFLQYIILPDNIVGDVIERNIDN